MIECFKSSDLHKKTDKAIPPALMELCLFVKGQQQIDKDWCGRSNPNVEGHKLLKFLPFSERSFLIYVADLVMAIRISSLVESDLAAAEGFKYPFDSARCFLDYVDVITDVNRCAVPEVLASTKPLLPLSCRSGVDRDAVRSFHV